MTRPDVAYLVLGEPGVDAAPLLASLPSAAARFYAPPPGRGGALDPTRAPNGVLPAGAPAGDAAVSLVRGRAAAAALVILNAGERPRLAGWEEALFRARRNALLPVAIPIAGGAVRHAPWFHGRRARLLAARGGGDGSGPPPPPSPRRPELLVRPLGSLADLLDALVRSAVSEPLPPGRAGSARILLEPALCGAKILAAGAWRDGVRGGLFAALHALHRLVLLARTWSEEDARAAAGEGS